MTDHHKLDLLKTVKEFGKERRSKELGSISRYPEVQG